MFIIVPLGVTMDAIKARLKRQAIETPSWGYGDSGTRFKTFPAPGAARNVWEKIDDAAFVQRMTGIAPSVALHIPWDKVENYGELKDYAEDKGVRLGAINPNLFQDNAYKLGSLCHPVEAVRRRAVEHLLECCTIMEKTGSKVLSLWFADGTNYPGQDDIVRRKESLAQGLKTVHEALPEDSKMLIEYKFFEPAFYHTDLADWGMAYVMSLKCGDKAQVLVDTGHHPLSTNIPHIVSFLLSERKLGGFHFNNRNYADDDLIVGSQNPFELFDIYTKIVPFGARGEAVEYMIDQSHNIEPKLEAMVLSVVNCQTALAKALSVDYDALREAQGNEDVLGAHRVLMDAFESDVRPLLREVRTEMAVPADPLTALREDNYPKRVIKERGTGSGGGGYPTA